MDNKIFKSKIMILKKNVLAQHMEPKFFDFLPEDFYQINKDQLMYMWHFLSDNDIAELYDIPARKVKNRRHDFNIKPVTSAIDRIERELYGREDWLEEELKSVLPFEYNNGNIPHTNSTPLNSEKEFLYMKATGIVRRIDDLGRVVIPKEIRRTMRIREGDPLEIFTDAGGEVVFKKYSPVGEMGTFASQYADILYRACGQPVIICDRDHVTAAAGVSKKEMPHERLSSSLEALIETRRTHILAKDAPSVNPTDGTHHRVSVCAPIVGGGDIGGAVCLLYGENDTTPDDGDVRLTQVAASFLGKQLES